jgi:hypothetical protein
MFAALTCRPALSALTCAFAVAPLWSGEARAQAGGDVLGRGAESEFLAPARNVGVGERQRPGQEALGLRLGTFVFSPSLDVAANSTSNVFANDAGERDDIAVSVEPALQIRSDWANHALSVSVNGREVLYQDFDDQDISAVRGAIEGRLDVLRGFTLDATVFGAREDEPLTELPTIGLRGPTEVETRGVGIGATVTLSRVKFTARALQSELDYRDGVLVSGAPSDQDFRDRSNSEVQVRADVAISPDTALFLALGANRRDFEQPLPTTLINQDSKGYQALAGVSVDLSELVRGELAVGVLRQSFEQDGVADINETALRGSLEWFPSPLVSVRVDAERGIGDSGVDTSLATIVTGARLAAEYEIARNFLLSGAIGVRDEDFQQLDRAERRIEATVAGEFYLNPYVSLFGRLSRIDQSADGLAPGRAFEDNLIRFGASFRR